MTDHDSSKRRTVSKSQSRIPKNTFLFDKLVPSLLIGMAVLTGVLILVALGVLFGVF